MSKKLESYKFQPGDVIIDNLSILMAEQYLHMSPFYGFRQLYPLVSFLEALVLYDRLVVDPLRPSYKDAEPGLATYIRQFASRHEEAVNRVVKIIPSNIITYLDISLNEKIKIVFEVEDMFKDLGTSGERLIAELYGQDKGGLDKIDRTVELYSVVDSILKATNDEAVAGKDIALHYLRFSGKVVKHAYYLGLSRVLGIPYVPNYQRSIIYKMLLVSQNDPTYMETIFNEGYKYWNTEAETIQAQVLKKYQDEVISSIDEAINSVLPWNSISVRIPAVFKRVLAISRDKKCSMLEAAIEMRDTGNAKAFRKWCREIGDAYRNSDRKALYDLLSGFIDECQRWSQQEKIADRKSQFSVSLLGTLGYQVELPDPVQKLHEKRSKHLLFLRDLI
jgi:hypothetical protein